jgi:hypothetical protein
LKPVLPVTPTTVQTSNEELDGVSVGFNVPIGCLKQVTLQVDFLHY